MYNTSEISWSSSSGQNIGENEYACLAGIQEKTLKCVILASSLGILFSLLARSYTGLLTMVLFVLPFSACKMPSGKENFQIFMKSLAS